MLISSLLELLNSAETIYRRRTSESNRVHLRALSVLPGGDTRSATFVHPYPVYFDHGEGAYLFDIDGNEYLDCANNWAVLVLGHARPEVASAVSHQVQRGSAWSGAACTAIDLAEELQRRVSSLERIRFTNSGTEAVTLAARAARAYTGRGKIARAAGSYHGSHEAFDIFGETAFIQDGTARHDRILEFEFNDSDGVSRLLERNHQDVAALIVEPFLTNDRLLLPSPGFLQCLRAQTERCGIILIFDEVVTLRSALGGAQEIYGIRPDLTTMGKMIGGGYPVGAFGGRREIMELFSPLNDVFLHHSGTFNGNPVTMTAGLETLRLYDRDAIGRLNKLGDRLRSGIARIATEIGSVIDVVGQGSLVYVRHKSPADVANAAEGKRIRSLMRRIFLLDLLNEGVVTCAPGAMFALSAAMTEQDVDRVIDRVSRVLDRLVQPARHAVRQTA